MNYPSGYGIVQRCVMTMEDVSLGAKALYGLLASYTGGNDRCWPSEETIAKNLGITDRCVRKYLKQLIEKDLIKKIKNKNNNVYFPQIKENDIGYTIGPTGTIVPIDKATGTGIPVDTQPTGTDVPPMINNEEKNNNITSTRCNKNYTPMNQITYDWEVHLFEGISDEMVQCWQSKWPKIDIEHEISEASKWVMFNPDKKKERWTAFLGNWFKIATSKKDGTYARKFG